MNAKYSLFPIILSQFIAYIILIMNSDEGMHMEAGSWAVAEAIIGLIGSTWYRYTASKKDVDIVYEKNAKLESTQYEQEQTIAALTVALELLKSENQRLQDRIDGCENECHERDRGHGIGR